MKTLLIEGLILLAILGVAIYFIVRCKLSGGDDDENSDIDRPL